MMRGEGDRLPVSAFPPDGTWPTATTQWEKRNIAYEVPVWDPAVCIQCMKCSMHCPHATIRGKIFDPSLLSDAPSDLPVRAACVPRSFGEKRFTIQVAAEDCTGCGLCVVACPAKNKENPRRKAINMEPQAPLRERQRENYAFFLSLPDFDRSTLDKIDVKTSQYRDPSLRIFRRLRRLRRDPVRQAPHTAVRRSSSDRQCNGMLLDLWRQSSHCPYTIDREGRGPAWANSLFEDNAEFGLGFRLAVDAQRRQAERLLKESWTGAGERSHGRTHQAHSGER